jgi:hypothetical protein
MDIERNDVSQFVSYESAQDLIECALAVSLVGLGAVSPLTIFGTVFTSIGTTLTTNV